MTVENVENAIKRLESIDVNDEYAYERAVMAFLTIKKLPVLVYEVGPGISMFRTRTNEAGGFFNKVRDIALAPSEVVKSFARCNRPFQSKLYGSENRPTSYMELLENWVESKKVGDRIFVTIGRWVTKASLKSIIVCSPDIAMRKSPYDIDMGKILDHFLSPMEEEFRNANIVLYRYLFDGFRKPAKKDPKTYLITTAYCNIALSHTDGVADAIFYPSVPFGGQGCNWAINANFIKPENIELVDVLRNEMYVEKIRPNDSSFLESAKIDAIKIDGELIQWRPSKAR